MVYAYDKLDRPTAAQSNMGELTSPSNGGDKIATLSYAYDGRGNLLHELQQHGDNVTTTTPSVEYGYTFTSANESTGVPNTDRLTTIKYPDRVYSNSTNDCRQFALSYGAEGSIDDRLSRLARIVDLSAVYNTVNNPPGKPIAAFAYAGLSRRVDLTYGENKMVTAEMAYTMIDSLDDMFAEYAISQLMDIEWATDWSLPDFEYAQSGWYSSDDGSLVSSNQGMTMAGAGGSPPRMPWNGPGGIPERVHGGEWHDRRARASADYYAKRCGENNVRFNQALVDKNGVKVSSLRPDVQVWDPKKQKYIIKEMVDTNGYTPEQWKKRKADMASALGVDPSELDMKQVRRGAGRRGGGVRLPHVRPGTTRRRH